MQLSAIFSNHLNGWVFGGILHCMAKLNTPFCGRISCLRGIENIAMNDGLKATYFDIKAGTGIPYSYWSVQLNGGG